MIDGERLDEARKGLGLSMGKMGKALGVTRQCVGGWISGDRPVPYRFRHEVCSLLKCTVPDIWPNDVGSPTVGRPVRGADEDSFVRETAETVRVTLKGARMSIGELGRVSGCSAYALYRWVKLGANPNIITVNQVCKALDLEPNQLFGWDK